MSWLRARQPGLRRPDFVFGKGRREHIEALEERGDIPQRKTERLDARSIEMQLVTGGIAVVLHDAAFGIELLVNQRNDVLGIEAAPRLRLAGRAVIGGD